MVRNQLYVLVVSCLLATIVGGAFWGYRSWQSHNSAPEITEKQAIGPGAVDGAVPVRISPQARANLGLSSKPLEPTMYWRTIDLPGVIVDRPGVSDRGVISPVTGIVTNIVAFPGDTVEPGSPLFAIRLVSESLHASQLELFKATRGIEIARQQLTRLSEAAGAVAGSRVIDIENEIKRLQVTVQAYRQDLQARGVPEEAIEAAAKGEFATEIVVRASNEEPVLVSEIVLASKSTQSTGGLDFTYELHTLQVELGEQVQAGQVLCDLADHRTLLIEGRAFKDDMPLIQNAAKYGWQVELDFGSHEDGDWAPPPKRLPVHHVANTVDPQTRTFAFYLSLENRSQSYSTPDGASRLLWRFRPGERLRLRVPVEHFENVFVLPREAVVHEGPEAFVFRQNGDLFDRRPVRVLYEDRLYAVLANDGSVRPGIFVAQNSAASLNRVLKAQTASGVPAGVHVHADGTVHGAH